MSVMMEPEVTFSIREGWARSSERRAKEARSARTAWERSRRSHISTMPSARATKNTAGRDGDQHAPVMAAAAYGDVTSGFCVRDRRREGKGDTVARRAYVHFVVPNVEAPLTRGEHDLVEEGRARDGRAHTTVPDNASAHNLQVTTSKSLRGCETIPWARCTLLVSSPWLIL